LAYQHYGMGINLKLIKYLNKLIIKKIKIKHIFLHTVDKKNLFLRLNNRKNKNRYDNFKYSFYIFRPPIINYFWFSLINIFGLNYVLFFSPALTILSFIQVLILSKIKFKFSRNILFLKNPEKNNLYKFFDKITFKSTYILIIRSFPILPHVLGSYIIASSKIKKKVILINTFFGSFFYYVFLYLIIR